MSISYFVKNLPLAFLLGEQHEKKKLQKVDIPTAINEKSQIETDFVHFDKVSKILYLKNLFCRTPRTS